MQKPYNAKPLEHLRRKLRTSSTDAERRLWQKIRCKRLLDLRFLRQYGVGNYILDFYCPKIRLGVEVDGGQHETNQNADAIRTKFLNSKNIMVLRFWDNDVLINTAAVLQIIYETSKKLIDHNPSPASPYLKGRVVNTIDH